MSAYSKRVQELLGIRVIGKRIYRVSTFEREGREKFACLHNEDAQKLVMESIPIRQRRTKTDQTYLVELAYRLGLPKKAPISILDIGSHDGMWPYLCLTYGHDAVCTDLPASLVDPQVRAMIDLFGVPSFPLKVKPLKSLEKLPRKYDLVTGLRTRFHSTKPHETGLQHETHWGIEEWDFFLRDLATRIEDGGQIFFMLNRLREKDGGEKIPAHMAEYFRSVGGNLDGSYLRFHSVEALR